MQHGLDLAGPAPLVTALRALLEGELELEAADLGALRIRGDDPEFASPLRLGGAMAVAALAAAAASAALGSRRGLLPQDLTVAVHEAARNIFAEHNHAPRLGGKKFAAGSRTQAFLVGSYRTADGRFFVPSALHPNEQRRWAQALKRPGLADPNPAPELVRHAFAERTGAWLEACAAAEGLAGVCCNTPGGWAAHPHGRHLLARPLVQRRAVVEGDRGPPRRLPPAARPLAGVRVLVFGRVFAGPLVGRTLAEQGADVLHVGSAQRPEHAGVYMDSFVGGRSAAATLADPAQRAAVHRLVAGADVVVDNTRPNGLAKYGLDGPTLLAQHLALVHLQLDAFGPDGPWGGRVGYDMNACAAAGLLQPDAAVPPTFLPSILLTDFVAGALGAAAVAAALGERQTYASAAAVRRALQINLCRVASWCGAFPRVSGEVAATPPVLPACRLPRCKTYATPLGSLRRLAPAVDFGRTPARWPEPVLVVQGSSPLVW